MYCQVMRKMNSRILISIFTTLCELGLFKTVKKYFFKAGGRITGFVKGMFIKIKPIDIPREEFNLFVPSPVFFFDVNSRDKYKGFLNMFDLQNQIIEQADKICIHRFNLLGSGEVDLGHKINWHQDFKSGFIWPKKYFKNIKTVDLSNNADVKVPWELSRFQHLACLGQAYWLTLNKNYVMEFKEEIKEWIEENPVEIGVNWACTMDVALRAVNWIIAYFYFKDCSFIDRNFWSMFYKEMYLTGMFINRNLECNKYGHGNNHYLSNLAGLVWLGLFFGSFNSKTQKWFHKGLYGLITEIKYQVNSEGTDFEASIPYHRLVTELFLSTSILLEKNGMILPEWYKKRLNNMCKFIMYYTKPNGLAPQIGDADDGRFHIFVHYGLEEKRDHRHILGVAGEYFDSDELRYHAGNERMDAVWLIGSLKNYKFTRDVKLVIKNFSQMGCCIIRDKDIFIIIKYKNTLNECNKGHCHNDLLSFELNIRGEDIIIDPGTYLYTADWRERNKFRGTAYHNTLQVNNEEQSKFNGYNLFDMANSTKTELVKLSKVDGNVVFIGKHDGYYSQYGCIYEREIIYNFIEKKITINDKLNKPVDRNVNFIFDEKIDLEKKDSRTVGVNKHITITFNSDYCVKNVFKSNHYGHKCETKKIEVFGNHNIQTIINF